MDNNLLIIIYFITLSFVVTNVLILIIKKSKLTKWTGYFALISAGLSIVFTYAISGHPPIYNKFTTLQEIVFIIILLGMIYNKAPSDKNGNINLFWFAALFFQTLILTQEMVPGNNYYMYDNPFVVFFFQFRLISIGIFLFAAINYLTVMIRNIDKKCEEQILQRARNYTMIGAVVYLSGEFCGSYWLCLWDGDSWHWSKGFFIASVMFLLSMIGSHLPAQYLSNRKLKAGLSFIPLLVIALIYMI